MTSQLPPELPIPQPDLQPEVVARPLRQLPSWRLWVPLAMQAALILAVPAQDAYTYATGKPVTLQTVPVDPYDLLRGYSQTLRYDISDAQRLKNLPGGTWLAQQPQEQTAEFYVILEAPVQAVTPPQAWKPVRISAARPTNLAANQVALQGQSDSGNIRYGLESYYMPEDQRQKINNEINDEISATRSPTPNQQAFVVEVKVDAAGNAVPVSLWVRDRNYRF